MHQVLRTRRRDRRPARLALGLALAVGASRAAAQPAPGSTLTFTGSTDAIDIGAAGLALRFNAGTLRSGAGNTGSFAFLDAIGGGAPGDIRDIVVGAGPQAVPDFVTLAGFTFTLRALPGGTFGQDECYVLPSPGQRCSPYQSPGYTVSPFELTNRASGDPAAPITGAASFRLVGTVTGPGGGVAEFFGTIASEFPGLSFQEALGAVEAAGIQALPYRATFTVGNAVVATVPEPASFVLVAAGLVATAAAGARGRRRRASAGARRLGRTA